MHKTITRADFPFNDSTTAREGGKSKLYEWCDLKIAGLVTIKNSNQNVKNMEILHEEKPIICT